MGTGSACRGLGLAGLALLLACAFTPLAPAVAGWLGSAPRIEAAEAIVVLGAGLLSDGTLSSASLRKTIHGIRLHRRELAPLLVFSGAPAHEGHPAESTVQARLARELGTAETAILTVATAWTTQEEAARVGELLQSRGIRRVLLVTESQHLVRATGVFERAGFQVFPAPADSPSGKSPEARLALVRDILEELLARLLYRLRGAV